MEHQLKGDLSPPELDSQVDKTPGLGVVADNGTHNHNHIAAEHTSDGEDSKETTCGLWGWSPAWLQFFASKKVYVLVYGILGSNQSAIGAYFIGTISTIEKRFRMPSTTSGIIASAWDIGGVLAAMLMAYFGSHGHKTRWVATGAIIAAISCYTRFIPHAVFGPGADAASYDYQQGNYTSDLCDSESAINENCTLESDGFITFVVLFLAHIALGVGTSTYYTLGAAYLDDNSLKNKVPLLFAFSTSLRMIGPSAGFLLASYVLRFYIDPAVKPPFDRDDPRWIGAWWLGWIPLGTLHIGFALIMALFPKTLPREALRRKKSGNQWHKKKKKSFSDFMATLLRLVKNPVLMYNSFSSTFYIFGMIGYWIFMPKYMETQFRQSASQASLLTGSIGLVCNALGVIASGAFVSKFRPRPTYLAAWNVFTESMDVLGHLAFAFLGCPKDDLHGEFNEEGKWNLILDCNAGCNCSTNIKYNPICSLDKTTTFYSPCHGGCTSTLFENGTKLYTNCSCIPQFHSATDGACSVDCSNQFLIFLVLLCTMKFFSSTGRAGNTIIQFRAVAPEDKSISIAMTEVLVCLIAFIPAPIIYGILLDSSCLIWGQTCGVTGNCWLYDGQILRYLLNFTASGFLLIATLLDVGVFCNVRNLKIYDEDLAEDEGEQNKGPENPLISAHEQ